ncbi:seizure protein 6 homolog isoform X1 [Tachysurus ichikawai]
MTGLRGLVLSFGARVSAVCVRCRGSGTFDTDSSCLQGGKYSRQGLQKALSVCLLVLNVTLEKGENVVLEDLGGLEPSILANKSGLMRGLVVKSSSNQISICFTSRKQPRPGSLLLRYRGETFSRTLQCAGSDVVK